ncbi:fatty acid desaturase family protein [Paeniglutamicibacter sp. ORCA_105]|uniref:fatty acid desaturase family protein n=1 Tax=Paeniglutamicibacter sp. ORCA_105 TaxID=3377336 RepID=UPI0038944C78
MAANQYVETYRQLSQAVHDAGLIRRCYGFYGAMIIGWLLALAALLVAVVLLSDAWYQLIIAALIGLVLTQLAFLSHEAAHQQIFSSRGWNEWTARILSGLFVGVSYGWWMAKHNTHHAHPNQEGADPDVKSTVLAFTPDASDQRRGLRAKLAKHQGTYFVPLLLFEGLNLHYASVKMLFTEPHVAFRFTEIALIATRHTAFLTLLFSVLPAGLAFGFVGIQVSVFGFLLGGAFALNHIGMPTVPEGIRVDFLRRQVNMSRNIQNGPMVRLLMGGLQYQIEHHLFPVAPRPRLRTLRKFVREHCSRHEIGYTERSMTEAFFTVVKYLNQVGMKNRDPYVCPLVQRYRG